MIRAFHLRDTRLVARLQRVGVPLDIEEKLTCPRSPLRSVLFNTFFSPRLGPTTFVLDQKENQKKLQGFAQVRVRAGRPERVVVFMSPKLESDDGSHATWQRLLTHLCKAMAQQGSLRIYARLPIDSEEAQIFRNVGFVDYGQEDFYALDQRVKRNGITSTLKLRPQQSSDGWGLQKLYATLTPRSVQNAEGLAQGQWDLTRRRWGEQGRRFGYVWEVDGELLGALHIRMGNRAYLIRTLLHPDAIDQTEPLCRAALKLTTSRPELPVYFAHRQYEAGWRHVLTDLGFAPLTNQNLMVKSMTVRVREKAPALISALDTGNTERVATSLRIDHQH